MGAFQKLKVSLWGWKQGPGSCQDGLEKSTKDEQSEPNTLRSPPSGMKKNSQRSSWKSKKSSHRNQREFQKRGRIIYIQHT